MKLSHKISLVHVAVILLVLGINAELRLRREWDLWNRDMRQDQQAVGYLVARNIETAWGRSGGVAGAEQLASFRVPGGTLRTAWFPLEHEVEPWLHPVVDGRPVVVDAAKFGGVEDLKTYVPVTIGGRVLGAIEVSEGRSEAASVIRTSLVRVIYTTCLLAAIAVVATQFAGAKYLTRPLGRLVTQARRVGKGDLSARLNLHSHDEIGMLAREMDQMCDQLQAAADQVRAETAARVEALQQLRHAERLATVGTLASGVAHELGTPLNVVSGRAKLIETDSVREAEARESARIIREQSERMTRIIRQLLDYSRKSGGAHLPGDLRDVAAQVTGLLRSMAQKQGVTLVLDDSQVESARVEMDMSQITQVVTNLIVNGVQAMPSGGRLEIRVERREMEAPPALGGAQGSWVCLCIHDEGTGIPEHVVSRIFDPFYTTKGVGEGTGLGLSVSHGIVADHGGWIDVRSEVGQGTEFRVWLPERPAA